jgi:hypothetical protein
VVFRDIFLHKPRLGFSVHFDNDRYSRSYYPGAPFVEQEQLLFDNIRVTHGKPSRLFSVATPVDVLTITNSSLGNNGIHFRGNRAMEDYGKTRIILHGCVLLHDGDMKLVSNGVPGKQIELRTTATAALHDSFRAMCDPGPGVIRIDSDLPGLIPGRSHEEGQVAE